MDKAGKNIFKIKHDAMLADIKYDDKTFDYASLSHSERVKHAKNFLKAITRRVGCNDYLFTLGITELDERYGKSFVPELWEILDIYGTYSDKAELDISKDDAFAAYYCLIHHYYRAFDCDKLKYLLMPKTDIRQSFSDDEESKVEDLVHKYLSENEYNKVFSSYPLIFELLSRYYAVLGDFDGQFKMAKTALRLLESVKGKVVSYDGEPDYEQQGVNYGAEIACANAVCSILEDNYLYGELSENPKVNLSMQSKDIRNGYMGNYSIANADISRIMQSIPDMKKHIDNAIEFATSTLEIDYPKYHYLNAKIKFYSVVLKNYLEGTIVRKIDDKNEIFKEIDIAVKLETNRASHDADKRTYAYNCLKDYVCGYTDNNLDKKYHQDRKGIISAASIKKLNAVAFPALNDGKSADYAFISYSSADFKHVYCDLLEMERRGINYWYDKGTCLGLDWKEIVRQRIKGCSVVLYYMSAHSVTSAAVIDELNYILQLKKPIICINLTEGNVTSQTLINIIRNNFDKNANNLTSATFKTLCTACPDYVVMLARDRDPLNVYHIGKLRKDLLRTYPSTIRYVESESAISGGTDKIYTRKDGSIARRPNEDYLICDELNKIYVVADGISRSDEEYRDFEDDKSVSGKVSEVFCNSMHKLIKEMLLTEQNIEDFEGNLIRSFEIANEEVERFLSTYSDYYMTRSYNQDGKYYEKPGCVAIAAFIFGNKLYYGSVGDCMGILYRGGRRIIFSDKQTDYAFTQINIERDRYKLYSEYVNKPDNEYGYGVVNGDKDAVKYFAVSRLDLEAGDIIYIASDGVCDMIKYGDVEKVSSCDLDVLMEKEDNRRDELGIRNDDKAIIKIKIN